MNLTPRGCDSIGGELASCMEECRNETMKLFSSWGYNPFNPAEFQLLEGAMKNLAPKRRKRLITVNSPFGEPCCIRADITLSALSYMALHYTPEDFPIRLCYAERVFAVPNPPKENLEDSQVGVELLGWEGIGSDVEVLALLFRTLDSLGLNRSVVVLGDVSIVPTIFANLPQQLTNRLIELLGECAYYAYDRAVESSASISEQDKKVLKALPSLKGSPDILKQAEELFASASILNPLKELVSSLTSLGYGDRIMIDLGFIRDLGYYTGPVFNVYSSSEGVLLGGGGRYEGMLSETEFSTQAVGFGLSLRELALACVPRERNARAMIWAGSAQQDKTLSFAAALAERGVPVEISWRTDRSGSKKLALSRDCSWWINMESGETEELSSGKIIKTDEVGRRS